MRKNVLEASQLFANEEKLKEHFLDTAKWFEESRGEVRALPRGLFKFGLVLLIVLAGITLSGVWIRLIYEPFLIHESAKFDPYSLFYYALAIFFVLFFVYLYDLKRLDAFFIYPPVYDFLKWLFIRCLIFASTDKMKAETIKVKEYLTKAKCAYEDYTNLRYIKNDTRKESLEKVEEVAKQFLKKIDNNRRYREENWEDKVEGTVPWAAIEALRKRFRGWYTALIVAFSGFLICFGVFPLFPSFLHWVILTSVVLVISVVLLILLVREEKNPSFLKNLHKCWDVIIDIEQEYERKKKQQDKDIQKKREMYKKVKRELKSANNVFLCLVVKKFLKRDTKICDGGALKKKEEGG